MQNIAQEEAAPENLAQKVPRLPRKSGLRTRQADTPPNTKVPSWVMPMIHKLCRSTGTIAAPPHVYVGMATAIKLIPNSSTSSELNDKPSAGPESLLALLVAVYLYVTFRLSGVHVTALRLDTEARKALEILGRQPDGLGKESPARLRDVHDWIASFQENGFLEMDWIQSVPKAMTTKHVQEPALASTDDSLGIQNLRGEADESQRSGTLLPGLGTMVR